MSKGTPKIICLSCFKELPELENIFSCSKKHYFCAPCGKSMHLQCECYESLHLLTLKNVEENPSGIECLGNSLNIWQCNWSGSKAEFQEHFIRSHNSNEIFSQFQVSSVPFHSDQLLSAMTLIRAFDSNFIFYYHTNPTTRMIYFLIFLLDGEEQPKPESFLYEFMIKSPKENHCKIKFVEKIFVLDDDVIRLRDNEQCAAITYQSIEKHLHEDHIHFSFLIKKNGKESFSNQTSKEGGQNESVRPKSEPYKMPHKGSLKINNVRKAPSVPDAKLSGGGVLKKPDVCINVELAKNQPPDYSSINRVTAQNGMSSPAFTTPSLSRNDEAISPSAMKPDECYHIPNISSSMCQTYKAPDHKMYKQKYPKSVFSKPILKNV